MAKSSGEGSGDEDQRVEYVESLLRSDDMTEQTKGLKLAGEGNALSSDRLADLVPALADCAADSNPYIKGRASTVLRKLVSTYPERVAPAVVDVLETLPFDDDTVAPVIGSLREEVRNSPDVASSVDVDSATSLLSSDCPEARDVGFTILGSSPDPDAVDELARWTDVGVPRVERAAREALKRLAERSTERLAGDDVERAAESLRRSTKVDPEVSQPHLDDVLSTFKRRPNEAFEPLLSQLLVDDSDDRSRVLDRLEGLVLPADPTEADAQTSAEVALRVLVGFGYTGLPTDELFETYIEWSDADDSEVSQHVCRQLTTLSDHSPDDLRSYYSDLATLVASAEDSVGERAVTLYQEAADSPRDFLTVGVPALAHETDRLAIDVLSDVLDVLAKRPEDETPERVECTPAVRLTLDDLASRFESGRNVPVVWPAYAPEVSVLLSLTLALEHVDEDFTVGLFSPGSRTQWGLKGQVRTEYDEYGLQLPGGFVPLSDFLPRGSVRGDEVVADDGEDGTEPAVVVSKKADELPLLAEQDCVVVQYCSRAKVDHREATDELLQDSSSCPVATAYSLYTKHETNGYPRYGPPVGLEETESLPSTRALETAVEEDNPSTSSRPLTPFEREVSSLADETEIEVREVRADEHDALLRDLEAAYEASRDLRDDRMPAPANKVFSLHLFFERLPLPTTVYDEGIRERHRQGGPARYIPNTVDRRVRNLERYGGNVDEREAIERVFDAVERLDRVADRLRDTNPIFDEIVEIVDDAEQAGDRVAVYAPSKTIRGVLERAIEDALPRLSEQTLSVVTKDSVRSIDDHDRLVFAGPQRPQEAGFYVHPRVDDVVVLTFDVEWASMIREHAEEYVQRLDESLGEPGNDLFATPTVTQVAPADDETAESGEGGEEEAGVSFAEVRPGADMDGAPSDRPDVPSGRRDSPRAADSAGLREAFEAAVTSEFSESGGNYDSTERVNYDVVTEDEETVQLSSEDRVFVKTGSLDGSYRWESPQRLEAGDEIEVLDSSVERELWASHLRETYSDELDGVDALATLELWDDALDETVEDWADRMGRDLYDPEVLNAIAEVLREAGCDRNPGTIRGWFRSALDAPSPTELARNPRLTIGPRDVDDVRLVGEAFDRPELVENARRIEAAMQAIRHVNRMEGRDFRSELLSQMNSDAPTEVKRGTTRHVVDEVVRSSEREESTGEDEESAPESDGSDQEDEVPARVADLVEMQPTTNAELADEWGYEDGSAVYGYLSQALDEYYYRDSDGLIRASDEAEDLVDEE